jgi:hypothetical protein
MKNLMTGIALFIITLVILMPVAKAQKAAFTGTIIYEVKAEGDVPEQIKSILPSEYIYKFSADKQSMSMKSGMIEQKTINDAVKKETAVMMSAMGQKILVRRTGPQIIEELKKVGVVTDVKLIPNETKTIAGYECKKAFLTMKINGVESTSDFYYTEDIDVSRFDFSNMFAAVKGFPLEFTMKAGPISIKMTVRSITKEPIPDAEFVIPSDYKEVTPDQLGTIFSGGAQ